MPTPTGTANPQTAWTEGLPLVQETSRTLRELNLPMPLDQFGNAKCARARGFARLRERDIFLIRRGAPAVYNNGERPA